MRKEKAESASGKKKMRRTHRNEKQPNICAMTTLSRGANNDDITEIYIRINLSNRNLHGLNVNDQMWQRENKEHEEGTKAAKHGKLWQESEKMSIIHGPWIK